MRLDPQFAGERSRASRAPVWRRWVAAGMLTIAATVGGVYPSAWAQRASQDQVEAAYLYNFGKFVRWPEGGHGPMWICVAQRDAFEQTVDKLTSGEQIDGRSLEVKRVDRPEAAAGCSILYVGPMDRAHADALLAAVAGKPVLTVGDGPDFLERGGMIQFVLVQDHVRFSVNLDAANRCGVGLSSELLKVAVRVVGKPEKEGAR